MNSAGWPWRRRGDVDVHDVVPVGGEVHDRLASDFPRLPRHHDARHAQTTVTRHARDADRATRVPAVLERQEPVDGVPQAEPRLPQPDVDE